MASRGTNSCTDGLQSNMTTPRRGGERKSNGGHRGGAKKGKVDVTEVVVGNGHSVPEYGPEFL